MTVLTATLTCPHCGHKKTETMPTNACVHFYECSACRTILRPKPGDCCIFCSYGSSRCPPRQAEGAWPRPRRHSIFPRAHEILCRQTRRHAHAERPAITGWPPAVVWPSPTSNAGQLWPADGVPPVWTGRRCDDPRYPVRQFSTLRHHRDCRHCAWRSGSRFRQRISSRSIRPPDFRFDRSAAAAPSAAPSL